MRIGDLLLMNGIITEEKLDDLLKMQIYTKKKLGELLIEQGVLTERMLGEILEFQLGFPLVNLYEADIDQRALNTIPEPLARKHKALPVCIKEGKLYVAMVDPLNYDAMEEISMTSGMQIQPMISMKSEIDNAITRYYSQESMSELLEDFGGRLGMNNPGKVADDLEQDENSAPIIKLVNQLIQSAIEQKASDIHIDPQEKLVSVRYRVDGVLRTEKVFPKNMHSVITARVKILSKLNIAERRLPQDGRIQVKINTKTIDIRVSTMPTVHGESVVMRILDQSLGIKPLSSLGFSEDHLRKFEAVMQRPNGIVLITGPTGSGKTSTLYSALSGLDREENKIITIEDPVEYRMDGVTQVQVNAQIGLTFASGLRSILRQDPNVVMVGEIRDTETAEIAIRASMTGHLVLSTVHTNSAISTITRLIDMGIDPFLIASSLSCVVAQRLVRRVCSDCATVVNMDEQELALFKQAGISMDGPKRQLFMGRGCSSCNRTGYKGRIALHEVLVIDEPMRRLIAQNRPIDELKDYLPKVNHISMLKDGLRKVLNGHTSIEEVLKVVVADE